MLSAFDACAQHSLGFHRQGVGAHVGHGQRQGAVHIVLPITRGGHAVNEVHGHVVKPRSVGASHSILGVLSRMGTVHPIEGVVVEALDANAQAVHSGVQPRLQTVLGQVFWIGLEGDFVKRRQVEAQGAGHTSKKGLDGVWTQE